MLMMFACLVHLPSESPADADAARSRLAEADDVRFSGHLMLVMLADLVHLCKKQPN